MSTEKSTTKRKTKKNIIIWSQVADKVQAIEDSSTFRIPIGCFDSRGETLCDVSLNNTSAGHMCIVGKAGTGKSKLLDFIIVSLFKRYGSGLTIHYIDGKGVEFSKYRQDGKSMFGDSLGLGFDGGIESTDDLIAAIDKIIAAVNSKETKDGENQIILMDDLSSYRTVDVVAKMKELCEACVNKNAHVLYTTQNISAGPLCQLIQSWNAVCVTRVSELTSRLLLSGSDVASKCETRYGTVFVNSRGTVNCYSTVFVDYHDIKKLLVGNDVAEVSGIEVVQRTVTISEAQNLLLMHILIHRNELLNTQTYTEYMLTVGLNLSNDIESFNFKNSVKKLEAIGSIIKNIQNEIDAALSKFYVNGTEFSYNACAEHVKNLKLRRKIWKKLLSMKDSVESSCIKGFPFKEDRVSFEDIQNEYDKVNKEIQQCKFEMDKLLSTKVITITVLKS